MLDVFADTPTGNHCGPPSTSFRARSVFTPLGFGCTRLATLAFAPPHPRGVKTNGSRTNYRSRFTPAAWRSNGVMEGQAKHLDMEVNGVASQIALGPTVWLFSGLAGKSETLTRLCRAFDCVKPNKQSPVRFR